MELAQWISKLLGLGDTFFSFHFSPYCDGSFYSCYSVPDPPLHLGADNWFSRFPRTYMESNSALMWAIPRASPTPDSRDKDDDTWEL